MVPTRSSGEVEVQSPYVYSGRRGLYRRLSTPRRPIHDFRRSERSSERDIVFLDRRLGGRVATPAESATPTALGLGLFTTGRTIGILLVAAG